MGRLKVYTDAATWDYVAVPTPTNANTVNVADEAIDTTCFPLFTTDATGDLAPKSSTNLTYNASTATFSSPTLKANYIVEKDAGNGVNIDSCVLKDGLVVGGAGTGVANSSLDTTAGNIGGAWTTFTPTFRLNGGGSIGNGTQTGRYTKIGKTCIFEATLTFGTTSTFTGLTSVSLDTPFTATSGGVSKIIGNVFFMTGYQLGRLYLASTTGCTIWAENTSGSYLGATDVTATVPHTWAASSAHYIMVRGEYEFA